MFTAVYDGFVNGETLEKVGGTIDVYKRQDLHSGATIYEAIGAYNMERHNEIITIVDKNEYQKLMNYISREDPLAFITIYNVSDMRYQPKR